ncbi:MAG TPA: MFS transporter [Novosphingobium sp.]|nr:MFS transporter [Novosphingobium sp.]
MNIETKSGAAEWKSHWPLVLACFVGYSFPSTAYYALGLFIDPLTKEFGWSRTEISAGPSIAALVGVPLAPLVGALADRWGVRRLTLVGAIATAALMASFGLANGTQVQWLVLWGVFGVAVMGLKSTLWASVISQRFYTARSMALAVALSGSALATTMAPPAAWWLIERFEWRAAWMYLGIGWGIVVFSLCALFVFDAHDDARKRQATGQATKGGSTRPDLPGLSIQEAFHSVRIWRIGLSTLLILLLSSALVVHKVPLLIEVGTPRATAAWLASLSGLAGLGGSLIVGWMIDKIDAGKIGFFTNLVTAVALVFLLEPFRSELLIVLSMLVVGFAGGAKVELCAYMTGKYAGLRNYGKIFGVMASIIAGTGAAGALVGGVAYDAVGSYDLLIIAAIPASVISAFLIVGLGPYPDWNAPEHAVREPSGQPQEGT